MVDIVITSSNVKPGSGASLKKAPAGATMVAGEVIYTDANGKLQKADANAGATEAAAEGILVCDITAVDQIGTYVEQGDVDLGSVLTKGAVYVLSANAGKVAPVADLASGWYTSILGVAKDADTLSVKLNVSGITTT